VARLFFGGNFANGGGMSGNFQKGTTEEGGRTFFSGGSQKDVLHKFHLAQGSEGQAWSDS